MLEKYELNTIIDEKRKNLNLSEQSMKTLDRMKIAGPVLLNELVRNFAEVRPVKNENGLYSAKATLEGNEELLQWCRFLRLVPFSKYQSTVQSKSKMYNSAVPLFMLAHKNFRNIPYSQWDKTDPFINAIIPEGLKGIEKTDLPNFYDIINSEDYPQARHNSCLIKKSGTYDKITSYKCSTTGVDYLDTLSVPLRLMVLQRWIWHSDVRIPGMILNWDDWDDMPEPVDSTKSVVDDLGF